MRRAGRPGSGVSARSSTPGASTFRSCFRGSTCPAEIEQIAILVSASKANHPTLGGGQVVLVSDLMREIMEELSDKRISENAVPEHHTLLRTLQLVVEYRKKVFATLR